MLKILRFTVAVVVTAAVVGLAFMLGLSFGLGSSHGKFISEAVPVLSMLSGWVAGIGALAAVLTTLWLADKQRREDVESLHIGLNTSIMTGGDTWFINLQITANGKRPALVKGVTFTSPYSKHACHITGFMQYGSQLPVQLSYGEQADFHLDYGTENQLANFVENYCGGRLNGLKVKVSTTLNTFEAKVPSYLLTLNE
jgi:hypothetical protein